MEWPEYGQVLSARAFVHHAGIAAREIVSAETQGSVQARDNAVDLRQKRFGERRDANGPSPPPLILAGAAD